MAEEAEVDLVEIAPLAKPPVCRLMDFGKFKYREAKKAHEAKLKQKQIQVKEVKFRPGTDEGDYKIKLRNLIQFLDEGDKTKVTLRFRGREMAHQEFGVRLLERVRRRSRAARRRRAVSEDGRPADGDGAGAEEEGRWRTEAKQQRSIARTSGRRRASGVAAQAAEGSAKQRVKYRRTSTAVGHANRKDESHAQDEDQEQRDQALPGARERQHQALAGVQAPHPHQEDRPRASASCAAPTSVHATNAASVKPMLPYA